MFPQNVSSKYYNVTNYIQVPLFSYACSNPCITLVKCIIKKQVKNVSWSRWITSSR